MYSTKINVTILDKNFVALQSLSTFPFSRGIILRWYHLLCSTSTLLRNNWHNMCSVASYLSLPCKIPQEFFLKLTYTYMLQFTNNCSHIHLSYIVLYFLSYYFFYFLCYKLEIYPGTTFLDEIFCTRAKYFMKRLNYKIVLIHC